MNSGNTADSSAATNAALNVTTTTRASSASSKPSSACSRREHEPGAAAREREQQAFEQEQLREPARAGAERCAYRELFAACHEPRQLQVRDIRAGDQQHREHEALKHEQPLSKIADHVVP